MAEEEQRVELPTMDEDHSHTGSDTEQTTWDGDFFGNDYTDTDFPMTADEAVARDHNFSENDGEQYPPFVDDSDDDLRPMPGLEDMSDSEDEISDDDSDYEDVDEPFDVKFARLVDRVAELSPPSSVPSSPSSASLESTESASDPGLEEEFGRNLTSSELRTLNEHLSSVPYVETFPDHLGRPGAPTSRNHRHAYERSRDALAGEDRSNFYAPFHSAMEWEVARWAKLRGPGSNALTELLRIPDVRLFSPPLIEFSLMIHFYQFCERLGLSFKTAKELDTLIDNELPGRPPFQHHGIEFDGKSLDTFLRDIIPCVRALWSDPELAPYLILAPERHYADKDRTVRLFFDMHTGRWWWRTQVSPLLIFSEFNSTTCMYYAGST